MYCKFNVNDIGCDSEVLINIGGPFHFVVPLFLPGSFKYLSNYYKNLAI